jgi:methylated-DNA-[protein]-cysteine S-methyltransferase
MKVGQSAKPVNLVRQRVETVPILSVFPSNLGWFGLLGRGKRLALVMVGHASADEIRRRARRQAVELRFSAAMDERDWHPALRQRLERYCLGERDEFDDILLDLAEGTKFQKRVLEITRRIKYGKTMSYGQLAAKAGYPRAARAVGTVMSSNRFPIVVPCHRVVASGGKTGGYTSPQGVNLKLRLLALEAGERAIDPSE